MTGFRQVTLICLLLVLIRSADGLRCYVCSGCNDPFDKYNVSIQTVADNGGFSCTKTKFVSSVSRGVSTNCVESNALGNGVWCCRSDLCNAAVKAASTSIAVFSMSLAVARRFF